MNPLVSGMLMVGGFVVTSVGAYQLSGAMKSPPFEYKTASQEERVAYLESESKQIARGMKQSLISSSGVGPSMRLANTEIDPASRTITFEIKVSGKIAGGQQFRNVKYAMLERICGKFSTSGLSRNDVSLVQRFVDKKKRTQGKITVSNSTCRSYL